MSKREMSFEGLGTSTRRWYTRVVQEARFVRDSVKKAPPSITKPQRIRILLIQGLFFVMGLELIQRQARCQKAILRYQRRRNPL